jgi:predicted nuclease of predicted toxin-antitoxin system
MIIWIDAHLSPAIATWITATFGITAFALRDIGLRDAEDTEIFEAARSQQVILTSVRDKKSPKGLIFRDLLPCSESSFCQ